MGEDLIYPYVLLRIVKFIIWLVDVVTDLFVGYSLTQGSREERFLAKQYQHSAHIVSLTRLRANYLPYLTMRLKNFLYFHERYVHPNYILENKNVTLYTIAKDYVLFCVTDPADDVTDIKRYPFAFIASFQVAQKLVVLPMDSFHRLANEVGDPKVDVCLVMMTSRCGSTVIARAMSNVPKTRSLSETWGIVGAHEMFSMDEISATENRRLLQSGMRLQCKVEPDCDIDRIVFKLTPKNAPQVEVLMDLFPRFKLVFNTRHPEPSLMSLKKVIKSISHSWFYRTPLGWWKGKQEFPLPYNERIRQYRSEHMSGLLPPFFSYMVGSSLFYSGPLLCYMENKQLFHDVILYEDLSARPEQEISKIFRLLNIPQEFMPLSLEAFKHDSQNKAFGERGINREELGIQQSLWKDIEKWWRRIGLVDITHDMSVDEFRTALSQNH